jgi:sphinganine C4-monooxygenase
LVQQLKLGDKSSAISLQGTLLQVIAMAAIVEAAFNNSSGLANPLSAYDALAGGPPYELVPTPLSYPSYYAPRLSLLSWISDKNLSLLAPVVIYWATSLFFELLDRSGLRFIEKYRIHEPEEVRRKNRVTFKTVLLAVFVQHILQTALGYACLDEQDSIRETFRDHRAELQTYGAYISRAAFLILGPTTGSKVLRYCGAELTSWIYWWGVPTLQFLWAR